MSSLILISIHQSACIALFDLCHHQEYAEPLRKEIESTGWKAFDKSGGRLFPLMDSFIKESARLNPVECSRSSPAMELAT